MALKIEMSASQSIIIGWIAIKCGAAICDPQWMNPIDFGDPPDFSSSAGLPKVARGPQVRFGSPDVNKFFFLK